MKETLDDRRKLGRIKGLKNQRELCTFEADTGKSKGTLEDEGRLQKILEDQRDLWQGMSPDVPTFKREDD